MNFKPWNTHPHVPLDIGSALSPSDGLMEDGFFGGSRGVTEGLQSCGCLLLRWSPNFSGQREIPKNSASDFWWRSTMASASSCMTIVPSPFLIWGKYYDELLHLWAVDWCQKSLVSFWWGYTLEMFTNWQVWQQNNDIDDNKLITRTILTYIDPSTNSKLSELFDGSFFHVLRKVHTI